MHLGSELLAHLADCAGEAACPAIGDGAEQASIPVISGLDDCIEHLLFRHRIADLHGMAELKGMGVGEFRGTECRPVDAITSRAPAESDDVIARTRLTSYLVAGHDPDAAAIDQGIAHIVIIKPHRPVEGGNPHAIAVITHALYDLGQDASGMQDSGGNLASIRLAGLSPMVGMGDTEHIRRRDGAGGKSGSNYIADAAADAGRGSPVGLDG